MLKFTLSSSCFRRYSLKFCINKVKSRSFKRRAHGLKNEPLIWILVNGTAEAHKKERRRITRNIFTSLGTGKNDFIFKQQEQKYIFNEKPWKIK